MHSQGIVLFFLIQFGPNLYIGSDVTVVSGAQLLCSMQELLSEKADAMHPFLSRSLIVAEVGFDSMASLPPHLEIPSNVSQSKGAYCCISLLWKHMLRLTEDALINFVSWKPYRSTAPHSKYFICTSRVGNSLVLHTSVHTGGIPLVHIGLHLPPPPTTTSWHFIFWRLQQHGWVLIYNEIHNAWGGPYDLFPVDFIVQPT